MPYRNILALVLAAPLLVNAGCAAAVPNRCTAGADCASGVCNADGTCGGDSTSSGTGSGGAGGGGTTSTGTASATSSGAGGSGGGAGGGNVCSPNHDGTITRAEVPLAAGLHATFRAAENATVDMAGMKQADGSRDWDLSGMLSGDHGELVETLDVKGQWFEADFKTASYASRLSDTQSLLGVFQITDTDLLLLGVVSPTAGLMQTKLTYNPPVKILSFPLSASSTWSTISTVSGQASGVVGVYSESYQSKIDAHGTLKTPFDTFPVLRVRTDLTRNTGGVVTTLHTFAFVTECFGTVSTVTSQNYELADDFTNAAEVTRLSP